MAEPVRLIFKYAKVPFEDDRIEREEWATMKPKFLGEHKKLNFNFNFSRISNYLNAHFFEFQNSA